MSAAMALVGVAFVFTSLVLIAYAVCLAEGGLGRRRASSHAHRRSSRN
jgi:hypothetical protein